MKGKAAIIALVVAGALGPVSQAEAGDERAQASRTCAQVAFTPNSDDVASGIRARGLTCGLARDFVRDSEGRPGARFRGFRCTAESVQDATMPYVRYRCTGAGDVIRWRRY